MCMYFLYTRKKVNLQVGRFICTGNQREKLYSQLCKYSEWFKHSKKKYVQYIERGVTSLLHEEIEKLL